MTRTYNQGVATLGYQNGPQLTFRLNPDEVDWNFSMNTAVIETIGGRVLQVLGANLSDITIKGSFGGQHAGSRTSNDQGALAEAFLDKIKQLAEYQSRDATTTGVMQQPAQFSFPPKGWLFEVYIRSLTDSQGGYAITHGAGKFLYDYVLTLMFHADLSNTSQILGQTNGALNIKADQAIASYFDRIYNGIGWKISKYNGPFDQGSAAAETAAAAAETAAKAAAAVAAATPAS